MKILVPPDKLNKACLPFLQLSLDERKNYLEELYEEVEKNQITSAEERQNELKKIRGRD